MIEPCTFTDKPVLATRDEFGSVTGMKSLKESQSWPVGFGETICSLHLEARKDQGGASLPQWVDYTNEDRWEDGQLTECMDFLRGIQKYEPAAEVWPEIPFNETAPTILSSDHYMRPVHEA